MKLIVDLEANGLYNTVDKVHCIVTKDVATKKIKTFVGEQITSGVNFLLQAEKIIGHNFINYDLRVIDKIFNIKIDVNRVVDTMLLSYMLNPHLEKHPFCPSSKTTLTGRKPIGVHSLENWGYIVGRGKVSYEDWSVFTEEMLRRCVEDVEITYLILNHLGVNINEL